MQITIDTKYDTHDDMRAAAAFLLHIVGDLSQEETPADPKLPAAPTVTARAASAAAVSGAANTTATTAAPISPTGTLVSAEHAPTNFVPPPPPPVPVGTNEDDEGPASNILNFPTPPAPPPPPPAMTAAPTLPPPPIQSVAPSAAVAGPVASAEVDKAGLPWDARIHQKSGNKKKDGTWKLIKGIDQTVVAAVVSELVRNVPPISTASGPIPGTGSPPAPVLLPGATPSVPVPPIPSPTAAAAVPAPPTTSSVPVPPVATVGAVGVYRALIDKITAATKDGKISPAKVSEVCQLHGAPSLMQLNAMPHLIDDVNSSIDAAILGL